MAPRVCFKQTSVTSRRDLPGVCVTQTLIKTQDAAVRVSCFLPGGLSASPRRRVGVVPRSRGARARGARGCSFGGGVMPKRHGLPEPCLRAQGQTPSWNPAFQPEGPLLRVPCPLQRCDRCWGPGLPHLRRKRHTTATSGVAMSPRAVDRQRWPWVLWPSGAPGGGSRHSARLLSRFLVLVYSRTLPAGGGAAVCDPECVRFPRAAPSQILARSCRGPQPHFEPGGVRTERPPAAGDLPGRGGGQGVIVTSPSSLFLGD